MELQKIQERESVKIAAYVVWNNGAILDTYVVEIYPPEKGSQTFLISLVDEEVSTLLLSTYRIPELTELEDIRFRLLQLCEHTSKEEQEFVKMCEALEKKADKKIGGDFSVVRFSRHKIPTVPRS